VKIPRGPGNERQPAGRVVVLQSQNTSLERAADAQISVTMMVKYMMQDKLSIARDQRSVRLQEEQSEKRKLNTMRMVPVEVKERLE